MKTPSEVDKISADCDEIQTYDEVTLVAQNAFGIKFLFPWQRLVIANILDSVRAVEKDPDFSKNTDDDIFCRGRQIVLLPTGAGKSLCFLVPSLLLNGITLVIYPLLALMSDQMRRMEQAQIQGVIFKGGQTESERAENFKKLQNGAKVVIANPEILQDKNLVKQLSLLKIAHIAIDEAHCVSEWGDSFRPAYLTLKDIINQLKCPVITAFTATASPVVLKRIGELLFDGHYHLLQSTGDRPNIHYSVKYAYAKHKAVLECVQSMKKPMIVFCGTRRRAETTARLIAEYIGYDKSRFYHAGMTKEEKKAVEQWFFDSTDGVLAATCAYGMGVDKSNIYSVVHLDPPEHLENFCQEAGRAGRNGDNVNSVLIWSYNDTLKSEQYADNSRERVMEQYAKTKDCRRKFMLNYLSGEDTLCSGCDICDAKKKGKNLDFSAKDAEFTIRFIKKHRRLYSKEELVNILTKQMNEKTRKLYGVNVWEASDINEILDQLLKEKKLKIYGGLWNRRIDLTNKKPTRRLPHWRYRRHFQRRVQRVLEQGLKKFFFSLQQEAFCDNAQYTHTNPYIEKRQQP